MELDKDSSENASPHKVLSVTDVSQFVFCPRQFHLSKILGVHRQPPEFVEGTLEHDARRLLNEALRQSYIGSKPDEVTLMDSARTIIGKTLQYSKQIAMTQHPIFTREIDEFIRELSFRFELEERERTHSLLASRAGPWSETVRASFPVQNEFPVFSSELQLRGRIDEVYQLSNGNLAIRDIKTAPVAFAFDESNQVQLAAYAMLLKEQESRKVERASVYSSRSLAERQVVVDEDLERKVLGATRNVREFLSHPELPEILTGPEALKCGVCFLREECMKLGSPEKDSRGIEALFKSHGKLSLFGDD